MKSGEIGCTLQAEGCRGRTGKPYGLCSSIEHVILIYHEDMQLFRKNEHFVPSD
jgi:hypothetical protein